MAINGNQWQSMVLNAKGNQVQSSSIKCNQVQTKATQGNEHL
jgi:hypothetical protein